MTMKTIIRPETEMKDSGVEWIKYVPENWNCMPLKRYFQFGKGLPITKADLTENGEKVISYGQIHAKFNTGVSVDDRLIRFVSSEYKSTNPNSLCSKGDIILADTSEDKEGCGNAVYIDCDEKIFAGYHTIILKSAKDNKYLAYLFQSDSWRTQIQTRVNGVKLFSITQKILNQCTIILPTLSEQQAIADYLDETCSKIDEIIAEAKASIDEYKELKQAVIFEAVTKGLDKNINVYKTGNSWIPSLPVGIKLSRFGLHHDIILGKMLCPNPRNEEDTLEPYYCAANVHFDGVTGVLKTMWFNSKEKETYVVHKNDMLIVEGGAGAGGAAIMNEEPPVSTFVQNSIMIVRSHMKDNRYSCYLVQALVKNKYVDVVCNKATIPHFTKEKVSYMPYPVFNRNERNEIANYLDERCKQIDSLIAEKESLINDLEAYKKSLIYEVVTGKRRVV